MKKTLILLTALILMIPGFMFSDLATFKVGYFIPRTQYELRADNLWWIEFDQMSFSKTNYQTTIFGFGYEYFFSNHLSLLLNVEGYSKNKLGQYLDYVGYSFPDGDFAFPGDFEGEFFPSHTFSVSITPFQLSVKITPLGRRMKIIPYLGGGVGVYLWSVRIFGDLIDFSDDSYYYEDDEIIVDPIYPIYSVDAREENKLKVGFQGFAGIMIPLANRISLEAEFKYNYAMADFSESAFLGFERFDLSGYQITIGMNYWF
jgi:opacity protein-like surface antigen